MNIGTVLSGGITEVDGAGSSGVCACRYSCCECNDGLSGHRGDGEAIRGDTQCGRGCCTGPCTVSSEKEKYEEQHKSLLRHVSTSVADTATNSHGVQAVHVRGQGHSCLIGTGTDNCILWAGQKQSNEDQGQRWVAHSRALLCA